MLTSKLHSLFTVLGFVTCIVTTGVLFAEDVQLPQTAAEHEAKANSYKDLAAQYKKAAEEHKQMAAAYAQQHPDFKGGVKNPWNERMNKHCEMLAKDYEKLAA